MSKIVIKYGTNCLSDYRPTLECPQWYWEYPRAFKFDSVKEARAFWDKNVIEHGTSLKPEDIRFVRHYTKAETQERRYRVRVEIEDLRRALADIREIDGERWKVLDEVRRIANDALIHAGRRTAKATGKP